MTNFFRKNTENILKIILAILIFLFCFSLFKNIQYPLLWNDEADTAMFGKRILKYGYPKIHDGKNVLYQTKIVNKEFITIEKIDGHLEIDWLQYYFATPFVYIGQYLNDYYIRTAILRIPFATIGFLGIALMFYLVKRAFKSKLTFIKFAILFTVFELLSISVALHLREMRYYSLVIFITAMWLYIYFRYHIFNNLSYRLYTISIIIVSLLMLFTFRPVFFIFLLFLAINGIIQLFQKKEFSRSNLTKLALPIIVLIILSIPYLIIFKVFYFAFEQSRYYGFTFHTYLDKIIKIFSYFWKFEFLPLAIFFKLITIFWIKARKASEESHLWMKISNTLSLFFILYILFITRIPYVIFTRYYITLQPILTLIICLDFFTIFRQIYTIPKNQRLNILGVFSSTVIAFFTVIVLNNKYYLQGHIYEIFHRYQGPLDYVIPYIWNNYKNPQNLVIATNYEEFPYMYYLGSKVTVGFVGNNLGEDLKIRPDIIIFRKAWNSDPEIFNNLWRKGKYKQISFSIADYEVNNIPDFNFVAPHLFKTKLAEKDEDKLSIFVKAE